MCRKLLFWGGGGLLVVTLVGATTARSYVKTVATDVKDTVFSAVPIGFEIERAKTMVREMGPEIEKNMRVIAKEEVQVARLEKQIAKMKTSMEKNRADIVRLRTDLSDGRTYYVYADREYTPEQVRNDLSARFANYKTKEDTLANLEKILGARQQGLDAARMKLDEMLAAKKQLEVDVENLEAQQRMVELAETTAGYQFDDSHLGQVRALIEDVQTRLDVAHKLAESSIEPLGQIPLDGPTTTSIEDEVAVYFELDSPAETVALDN